MRKSGCNLYWLSCFEESFIACECDSYGISSPKEDHNRYSNGTISLYIVNTKDLVSSNVPFGKGDCFVTR